MVGKARRITVSQLGLYKLALHRVTLLTSPSKASTSKRRDQCDFCFPKVLCVSIIFFWGHSDSFFIYECWRRDQIKETVILSCQIWRTDFLRVLIKIKLIFSPLCHLSLLSPNPDHAPKKMEWDFTSGGAHPVPHRWGGLEMAPSKPSCMVDLLLRPN